jgi:uncharacterized damage-inducible protein DinB
MTPAITLEELLKWTEESAAWWKAHLEANPALLDLPCGIGGAATVHAFVRHIWAVDLRWAQRLAGLPATPREEMPEGPLDALFGLHTGGMRLIRTLLDDPEYDWNATLPLDLPFLPPETRNPSRRKVLGHALLHSQRHWAQLATLVRAAGFPSGFRGDFLFCAGLA